MYKTMGEFRLGWSEIEPKIFNQTNSSISTSDSMSIINEGFKTFFEKKNAFF